MHRKTLMGTVAAVAVAALTTTSAVAGTAPHRHAAGHAAQASAVTRLSLTPSSPQLAACMPHAKVKIAVSSTVDQVGFDTFRVKARHLAPNRSFTVFLLQQAGAPFGAAEYIGDITTNAHGDAYNRFNLIVDEAFSSTLDNTGQRVRVDLNQVGMWFADPADDDFCAAAPGIDKVTPFDGDNEAGVQAFNSANTQALPAP
jgi:hypothetical protein